MGIRQFTWPSKLVYVNGSGSDLFFAISPLMDSARIGSVRPSIEMCQSTGDITMEPAYR